MVSAVAVADFLGGALMSLFPFARRLSGLFGLVLFLGTASGAQAATLASVQVFVGSANNTGLDFFLSYGPTEVGPPTLALGDGLGVFTLSDAVGTIFSVDATNDPDFAAFEALMTDGLSPPQFFGLRGVGVPNGGVGAWWESASECALFADPPLSGTCVGGIDLAGYDIQSVEFELLSIQPFSVGGLSADVEVRVIGEVVPEPSTALLMATGLMILGARRR